MSDDLTGVRIAGIEWEPAAEAVDDAGMARLLGVEPGLVAELGRGRVRHLAPDGEGSCDIALRAARRLIDGAGLTVEDLDLILFSTNSPDIVFPGSACLLQAALECPTIPCLDIRAQCTGFIAALELAGAFVSGGTYARVLVATGEVPSHQNRMDGTDPELACLTADAAAVALVEGGQGAGAVLACEQRVDGRRYREFWCEYPACRRLKGGEFTDRGRIDRSLFEENLMFPTIDFDKTAATALENVPAVLEVALAEAGLERADALILAHVDPRVEEQLGERLAARADRVLPSDHVYAYSASLPAALARAVRSGAVESGETVALATAGQGASWGAVVVRV